MVGLIVNNVGASLVVLYVGNFAVAVGRAPLVIIAAVCLALMLAAVCQDIGDSRKVR